MQCSSIYFSFSCCSVEVLRYVIHGKNESLLIEKLHGKCPNVKFLKSIFSFFCMTDRFVKVCGNETK